MQKMSGKGISSFKEKIMVSSFLIYDLVFLALFLIFFSVFLYTRKHNLRREGLLFLYRAQWGVKLIDYLGKRYKKTLNFLSYVSIVSGYLLMIGMFYLAYVIVKIYFFSPDIVRAIKVPPILPLVPYLPQVFKLEFLPPFYFTYWIVILAVIAISHEMAHGIFMRRYNMKIKSTGFAFFPYFFPVFPAAFVEQDEKSMNKAKKFHQMAVLSAGTFANVLTAILFFGVLWIFFSAAFAPSGVIYDSYATSLIPVAGISSVNGITLGALPASYDRILSLTNEEGLNELEFEGKNYLATKEILENQKDNAENLGNIFLYNSAPAIKANLSSIITEINGEKVDSIEKLIGEISKYSPGDEITVKTQTEDDSLEQKIVLEEHPERPGTAWLGIGFVSRTGVAGKITSALSSFKEPNVYYAPKIDGISIFIYNLLWWLILISISVALVNMLPVGIFDGGRFFYLTILAITKNEKTARRAFSISTQFFLFLLLLLLILWGISFFR